MAVVGASGVVFGLAGATIADMALNFESLGRPVSGAQCSTLLSMWRHSLHVCKLQTLGVRMQCCAWPIFV